MSGFTRPSQIDPFSLKEVFQRDYVYGAKSLHYKQVDLRLNNFRYQDWRRVDYITTVDTYRDTYGLGGCYNWWFLPASLYLKKYTWLLLRGYPKT